jgi:Ca2+-binding EF-hand superfamily protein
MMMMGDPSRMMDMLFQGKDSIDMDAMPEMMRAGMQRFAQMMGISGNIITRQQVEEGAKKLQERFASGGFGGMPGAPGGAPTMTFGSRDSRGDRGDRGIGDTDSQAESFFRRYDKDNDGVLSAEEMSDSLRDEREKWDQNRDGFIDLSEYKLYFSARIQQNMQERREMEGERGDGRPSEDGDRKPVVFRAGKLPKELPSWFVTLDTDSDTQVGLYEWRAGGRPISEFKTYDRNGDNFLTVEEVLLVVKLSKPLTGGDSVASANGGDRRMNFAMPGMPGAPGGDGMMRFGDRFSGGDRFGSGNRGDRGDRESDRGNGGERSRFPGIPGASGTPGGSGMPGMPTMPGGSRFGDGSGNPFGSGRDRGGKDSNRDDSSTTPKFPSFPSSYGSGKRSKRGG